MRWSDLSDATTTDVFGDDFTSTAPFYMWGRLATTGEAVAVAATPTKTGWRCRSTARDALNHDYVSRETTNAVRAWVQGDLRLPGRADRVDFTRDRAAMAAHLATLAEASADGSVGFLAPEASSAPREAAERVLRHLERGWRA